MVHLSGSWPYVFWLLVIMVAAYIAAELQTSPQLLTVAGPQAAVAVILTMVPGNKPALSLTPGLESITGMMGAPALLFTAPLLFPTCHKDQQALPG